MAKRIYYSKNIKRQALISVANGMKLEDFLRNNNYQVDYAIEKDKKYCAKLLYKWRKELYQNNELIYFSDNNITPSAIENELKNLDCDDENDIIMAEMKNKILQGVNKYKHLKNRILSKYNPKSGK